MKPERVLEHPGLNPLWRALHREAAQQWLCGVLVFFLGLAVFIFGILESPLGVVLGLGVTVGGVLILRKLFNQPLDRQRLCSLILDEPERIVWVYGVVTERLPFGWRFGKSGLLYIKLSDGDEVSVALPARRLRLVTKILGRALPHAAIGYTDHLRQLYDNDPSNLRKK